jgi:hypothetical protein
MTIRLPVSTIQNNWTDAQKVDMSDMSIEQENMNGNFAAIVQNMFGSGVLLESPTPVVLWDSDNLSAVQAALQAANNLDGTGLTPTTQPTDTLLGNQLSIEYTNSSIDQTSKSSQANAIGRNYVKLLIIGLDFEGNLQYDRFEFHKKETQTTYRHYARILTIILNGFDGNNNCSGSCGGRLIIKEALPYELNRDAIMVAQDVEPNIFIRDIRPADCHLSIYDVIQTGIGTEYDADNLEINITARQPQRAILPLDVSTQIGQKFLSTTDNIQKITALLSVSEDTTVPIANRFDWTGDLIVSVYKLQTTTACPTDILPELAIDFDPEERPLAELSFSQSELLDAGYVLTNVPQPIDFVFTNSIIAAVGGIEVGKYYAFTVRRSGSADAGTIYLEVGNDRIDNSRLTVFNAIWVDVPEEDLWFQVWSNSAKFASGQAYDRGNGIICEKTEIDPTTGATIDNWNRYFNFISNGEGVNNIGVLQAAIEQSITTQDERTGNNIYSRKQYVPSFGFVSSSTLTTLKQTSEPLTIGAMSDINPKTRAVITKTQSYPGLANGASYIIINPDADLLSNRLVGRKLIPDNTASYTYRIYRETLCTDGYGDVNGDGVIDIDDVARAAELIGYDISDPATQQDIIDGYATTLEILRADVDGDGIVSAADVDLIERFVNREDGYRSFPVGTYFTHLELEVQPAVVRNDGYWTCNWTYNTGGATYDGYVNPTGPAYVCPIPVDPATLTATERLYYGNIGESTIDTDNAGVWQAAPFVAVDYDIIFVPFWADWMLALNSSARSVPSAFTYAESIDTTDCTQVATFECSERSNEIPDCDPGRNDFYVPGNLIVGSGSLIRTDGTPLPVDIEVGIVNLELGAQIFSETSFDIFHNFVADRGDGFTNANYPAMRYSDCTTVQPEDLAGNKIRFNVSIQSFVPSLDGYDYVDGYGIIVDDVIAVYMDHANGILRLTTQDLDENPLYATLVSKVQIVVYLKKAAWKNQVLTISPAEMAGLGATI